MRVLITGAAGFLGSHILDQSLERGHSTRIIVRKTSNLSYIQSLKKPFEIYYGDLCDAEAVHAACEKIDLIIHSAGRVTDEGSYEDFYLANVVATQNLLTAARAQGVKLFVFVSSPSIFAGNDDHVMADESLAYPAEYANYYAKTKALAEQEVLAAHGHSLVTCSLRPRGIWGERDYNGFFPKLLKALSHRKLRDFSGGRRVEASLCHAENIAEACFQAAAHPQNVGGQAYFIADAETVFIWDFLEEVRKRFDLGPVKTSLPPWFLHTLVNLIEGLWRVPYLRKNVSPPLSRYALAMLSQHSTYSIAKARRDFGYDPKRSISKNLENYFAWIEKQGGLGKYLGL